jgi:hypothetical protein
MGVGLVAVIALVAFGCGIAALVLRGTKGQQKEWPALATSLPQARDGMVWWRKLWLEIISLRQDERVSAPAGYGSRGDRRAALVPFASPRRRAAT